MIRHSHVEELVGAHAQDDERAWIEISQWTIDVTGDHPVESADRTQRAVDELGGEGSVPIGEVTSRRAWRRAFGNTMFANAPWVSTS